jgi:hypothetical protein
MLRETDDRRWRYKPLLRIRFSRRTASKERTTTDAGAAGDLIQLARVINFGQFFTLAFGCIIHVA